MRIFIKYIIVHSIIIIFTFIRIKKYKLIALYFLKDEELMCFQIFQNVM